VLPPGSEICPACLPRGKIVLRMLGYIRPYAGLVILSFVATLAVTLIGLSPPMMMRALTDGALAPPKPRPIAAREHLLWIIVFLLFLQRVGNSTFSALRTWLNGYTKPGFTTVMGTCTYNVQPSNILAPGSGG
jgi:ABC-type bacteriocin/lantibiotic exporter with double-glycine peptidase domain